jgi:thymidylate synthase (FAD)
MNPPVRILDHGYIRLIESYGSDMRVVEAARMSTDKGFLGWEPEFVYRCGNAQCTMPYSRTQEDEVSTFYNFVCPNCHHPMVLVDSHKGDQKLLAYLYKHKHMTPFEMAGMIIEVQAPIFVFREWHRHRTQSYNEMSARYVPLPNVNYVPSVERLLMTSSTNKQAQSTGNTMSEGKALFFQAQLENSYANTQQLYQSALDNGVPKELARLCIPVGRYSRMRAASNLRNWLAFLTLRMDTDAQWEIRQYANAVADLIEEVFPRTYQLFNVTGPIIK